MAAAKLELKLLLLLLVAIMGGCHGEMRNTITHIKGFDGPLPFTLETGYVEVEETYGVHLFYYFIPSERNPREDPLIVWFSGGPGCSGLNALFNEIGPLKFDAARRDDGEFPRLVYFQDAWTQVSNVLFLDVPVGTGFSYARDPRGLNVTLTETGRQLRIFLERWLAVDHPELASNPLYLGGDSYGGYTTTVTALEIANHPGSGVNLVGYMVGNSPGDGKDNDAFKVPFLHGMGLISDELFQAAHGRCRGDYVSTPRSARCSRALQAINAATEDINPLHILEPCISTRHDHDDPSSYLYLRWRRHDHDDPSSSYLRDADVDVDQCRVHGVGESGMWANDAEVREMLGIREGSIGGWSLCTILSHLFTDVASTIPYHRNLTQRGYRALVYNGDHDLTITFLGTQAWIRTSLGYPVVAPWRPWYTNHRQVAGYTTQYAYNLTFATVKGAGHMAPESRPKECLHMLRKWTTSPAGTL